MRSSLGIAVSIFVVLTSTAAVAGPPEFVEDSARTVPEGRAAQTIVAQSEVQSDINKSMVGTATGGGMLGALIDASIEQSRAKKAEAAITPLREALAGFNADDLAQSVTKATVEATPWLQPVAVTFAKDSSVAGKSGVLDAAGAGQVAFFEYTYDVAPAFESVRVKLSMQFANRALPPTKNNKTPKPESRVSDRNLVYAQTITSIVLLPSASEELEENAPRWSADNAVLARKALTQAFHQVERFAPRALALNEADIKAMKGKDRKRMGLGGFYGRQQPDADPGTLIWGDEGFVYAQAIDETQPAAVAAPEPATLEPTAVDQAAPEQVPANGPAADDASQPAAAAAPEPASGDQSAPEQVPAEATAPQPATGAPEPDATP